MTPCNMRCLKVWKVRIRCRVDVFEREIFSVTNGNIKAGDRVCYNVYERCKLFDHFGLKPGYLRNMCDNTRFLNNRSRNVN